MPIWFHLKMCVCACSICAGTRDDKSFLAAISGRRQDVSEQDANRFARDIGPAVLDELAAAAEASDPSSDLLTAMWRYGAINVSGYGFITFWCILAGLVAPGVVFEEDDDGWIWVLVVPIAVYMLAFAYAAYVLKAAVKKAASGTVADKCAELSARFPGTMWTSYARL